MAFSCLLIGLSLVTVASGSSVVRRAAVESNGQITKRKHAKAQLGMPFWRSLRQGLELKKMDLEISADTRRELLWHAVREVDDKFHQKYLCKLDNDLTYAKDASAQHKNIGSSRECALMCAADPLAERGSHKSPCKSFTYNKTAKECRFFNFAQQEQGARVKDTCCTSGPPCNLDSMREEIQKMYEVEMKRTISSQKQLTSQLQKASERLADHKKATQRLSLELKQTRQHNAAPMKTDSLKIATKPATKAATTPATKPATKAATQPASKLLSDRISHISHGRVARARHAVEHWIRWHRWLVIGFVGVFLAAVVGWRFRGHLVSSRPLKNNNMHPQHYNDHFTVSKDASQRAAAAY